VALVSLFGHELVPDFARFLMSLDPQWGHFIFCLFWFLKTIPSGQPQLLSSQIKKINDSEEHQGIPAEGCQARERARAADLTLTSIAGATDDCLSVSQVQSTRLLVRITRINKK
jgi:hypothetical protein